ncbi:hypothetical protein [Streptomyces sp. DG1A-41]|uniref:hypothetical protein n=1 Tax=Streptomyces sp. DG1A-41 TaxID=3125779 RepID=UPI0030D5ED5C
MSSERPINPRFAEDMWFEEEPGGPPRYQDRTDKSVQYFTVVDKQGGAVLGYVWASDEGDAAAYEPRQGAGGRGVNAGISWIHRLRDAKKRGLRPSEALAKFLADPEPGGSGRPVPNSLTAAPNSAAVEALAQSGYWHRVSNGQPMNSRFEEDLQFREKPGGPARYQDWTENPVQYFTVVDKENSSVLGYVWADADDAAAYEPRKAGGPRAVNAGMPWIMRLREGKARGLRPTQTLVELYGDPQPGGRSRPLPGSLADAPNAAAVEALAQGD